MHTWVHMKLKENTQNSKSKKSENQSCYLKLKLLLPPRVSTDLRNLELKTGKATRSLKKKKAKDKELRSHTNLRLLKDYRQ